MRRAPVRAVAMAALDELGQLSPAEYQQWVADDELLRSIRLAELTPPELLPDGDQAERFRRALAMRDDLGPEGLRQLERRVADAAGRPFLEEGRPAPIDFAADQAEFDRLRSATADLDSRVASGADLEPDLVDVDAATLRAAYQRWISTEWRVVEARRDGPGRHFGAWSSDRASVDRQRAEAERDPEVRSARLERRRTPDAAGVLAERLGWSRSKVEKVMKAAGLTRERRSLDEVARIARDAEGAGERPAEAVARRFECSKDTAYKLLRRAREAGELEQEAR